MHDMVVPTSQSRQSSWWGLVSIGQNVSFADSGSMYITSIALVLFFQGDVCFIKHGSYVPLITALSHHN